MAAVSLRDVRKSYGDLQVIHGVNMDIADGEFIVILGPSGCGKSTLLRMVAGLEAITAGEIRIGERVVNDLEPTDRNIAMVFQNYALYPHMSVYDNMSYGLSIKKFSREEIETRVRRAADSFPAASASAWRWAVPSCASPPFSCSTSRSPTSTPSCGCRCVPSCNRCTGACARRACS